MRILTLFILPVLAASTFLRGLTFANLTSHNTLTDCMVVFKGNVYNLTDWIPKHPGGPDVYTTLCGTLDFEQAFTNKHPDKAAAGIIDQVAQNLGPY